MISMVNYYNIDKEFSRIKKRIFSRINNKNKLKNLSKLFNYSL